MEVILIDNRVQFRVGKTVERSPVCIPSRRMVTLWMSLLQAHPKLNDVGILCHYQVELLLLSHTNRAIYTYIPSFFTSFVYFVLRSTSYFLDCCRSVYFVQNAVCCAVDSDYMHGRLQQTLSLLLSATCPSWSVFRPRQQPYVL